MDEYTILNIPYAQYIKGDLDFAKNIVIDNRNSHCISYWRRYRHSLRKRTE